MYAYGADHLAHANGWMPVPRRAAKVRAIRGRTVALALAGVGFVVGVGMLLTSGEAATTVSGAARALGDVHWAFVPALAGLMVAHFWFSAVALRGAAGQRLPLLPATMAQFTAAAANRVTGGGLGTVAVNARYLSGRGTPATRAVAAAGVLQVGGAIADLFLFAVVIPIAMATGGGFLLSEFVSQFSGLDGPAPIVAGLAGVIAGVTVWLLRDRLRDPIAACAEIVRRPADLLVMLVSSAATTLVMGLAFALSMLAIPGAAAPGQIGTLIAIYMIGAAAGGVIPGPGGLGSTEAALVGLLSVSGVGTTSALSGVLIFRAITHWAPVPIGLLSAGTLRKRQATSAEDAERRQVVDVAALDEPADGQDPGADRIRSRSRTSAAKEPASIPAAARDSMYPAWRASLRDTSATGERGVTPPSRWVFPWHDADADAHRDGGRPGDGGRVALARTRVRGDQDPWRGGVRPGGAGSRRAVRSTGSDQVPCRRFQGRARRRAAA